MVSAESRNDVRCHACQALLGTLNDSSTARRGQPSTMQARRLVTTEPGVRQFVDYARRSVSLFCPDCGACGRTVSMDSLRGAVIPAESEPTRHAKLASN